MNAGKRVSVNARQCDDCRVCCSLLGFTEKPETFQCEWLKGSLKEELRPDKLGILFSLEENRSPVEKRTLVAREFILNSFQDNSTLLNSLSKRRLLLLQKRNSYSYLGPVEEVEKVKHLASRARQQ